MGQVARRIARRLERRDLGPEADPSEADPLAADEPLLPQLYGASVASRIATGRRAGRVPPLRFHGVRYHGILGPCAGERDRVAPGAGTAREPARPPPGNQSPHP